VICPVPDEIHQAFSLQDLCKQGTLKMQRLTFLFSERL